MSDAGVTIMVVDDEAENAHLVERAFRQCDGIAVVSAASGAEALTLLETTQVDIVIVDQAMPGMTGVAFVELAKPLVPKAVFVMVTAYPELEQVLRAQRTGIIHHLVAKPWRPADLRGAVRRALIMRDLRSAVARLRLPGESEDGGPE